jgi:hypothetical protein
MMNDSKFDTFFLHYLVTSPRRPVLLYAYSKSGEPLMVILCPYPFKINDITYGHGYSTMLSMRYNTPSSIMLNGRTNHRERK